MNKWAVNTSRALVLGVVALVMAACSSAAAATAGRTASAVPVQVAKVEIGNIAQVFSYAGTLQAKDTTKIVPLVSGRVMTVSVDVGDVVKAGDVIAALETDVYQAQVRQAAAGLKAAQAKLVRMQIGSRPEEIAAAQSAVRAAQVAIDATTAPTNDQRTVAAANMARAEATLRLAQHDYDKIAYAGQVAETPQALALEQATIAYQSAVAAYNLTIKPTDGQLAPLQNQLTQAQLKLALTKQPYIESDLAQAQAAVDQATAAVDLANTQLGYTILRAPFDGTISELFVTKGAVAGPSAPVVTLLSATQQVVVYVEESRIGQITVGQNAALRLEAMPGRDLPAKITSVAPMADATKHSFMVKVTPGDSGGMLRPGMYADVAILAGEKQAALLVPSAAVSQVNGQTTVYVVKGTAVEQRKVVTGLTDDTRVEILSGLQAGDTVVTTHVTNLADGAEVLVGRSS